MVRLAVVGAKKSGKTSVIEGLTAHLCREGYRVATVKHTSHVHQFDTPGKDSWRHRQAGAALTVAAGSQEIAVFARPDVLDVSVIQQATREQFDIWLIEGDRLADHPKVLVTHPDKELPTLPENVVATIGPHRIASVSVHFETGDSAGLASWVIDNIIRKKP
jgi:molybdopterin-guanine dinucleotide biosynthesis protein B